MQNVSLAQVLEGQMPSVDRVLKKDGKTMQLLCGLHEGFHSLYHAVNTYGHQ
jgi:hypothetical protein